MKGKGGSRKAMTGSTTGKLAGSIGNKTYKPPQARQPGGKPGPQTMPMGGKTTNGDIKAA